MLLLSDFVYKRIYLLGGIPLENFCKSEHVFGEAVYKKSGYFQSINSTTTLYVMDIKKKSEIPPPLFYKSNKNFA